MVEERTKQLSAAAEHIASELSPQRIERGVAALERRLARRRTVQRATVTLSACVVLALGAWLVQRETTQLASNAPRDVLVETRDGSRAEALGSTSSLVVERDAPQEVAVRLKRGKGHFAVTPNKQRRYRVRAGDVEIEVLGTAFVVERVGSRTHVRVEHGVVKVGWKDGSALLRAGDEGLFPPPVQAIASAAPSAHEAPIEAATPLLDDLASAHEAPEEAREKRREHAERWRSLARAGKHQEAFGSLGRKQVDDLSGLLLAADAARLSGHPREAARYLEQLIARYPRSASAHLSAFTLGRLALYELNQPKLAAESFARAYALNERGPLAEDALAREAEAYHRAGDDLRAKRAAERYLERYPRGARRRELERYAGRTASADP